MLRAKQLSLTAGGLGRQCCGTGMLASAQFKVLGFRVKGSGFRVQGLGFSVQGLGFRLGMQPWSKKCCEPLLRRRTVSAVSTPVRQARRQS